MLKSKTMHQNLNLTGGARIGRTNASYPFATLQVDTDSLTLDVSLFGKFVFRPVDIISIEPYTLIPILGQGIRINHRVPGYNPKIIFWTTKDPSYLVSLIKETGFLDDVNETISEEDIEILKRQKQVEFPINPIVFIVLFLIGSQLFVSSFLFFPFKNGGIEMVQRAAIIVAAIIFITCVLTMISTKFQKLILLKDREYGEIKRGLMFFTIIIGFILISTLLISIIDLKE